MLIFGVIPLMRHFSFDKTKLFQVFSPLALKCVNLYHVPKEAGGLRPECGGRPDGTYPEDSDRHDLFYVCKGGHFGGIFRCPQRRPFYDAEAKVCVSRSG